MIDYYFYTLTVLDVGRVYYAQFLEACVIVNLTVIHILENVKSNEEERCYANRQYRR